MNYRVFYRSPFSGYVSWISCNDLGNDSTYTHLIKRGRISVYDRQAPTQTIIVKQVNLLFVPYSQLRTFENARIFADYLTNLPKSTPLSKAPEFFPELFI